MKKFALCALASLAGIQSFASILGLTNYQSMTSQAVKTDTSVHFLDHQFKELNGYGTSALNLYLDTISGTEGKIQTTSSGDASHVSLETLYFGQAGSVGGTGFSTFSGVEGFQELTFTLDQPGTVKLKYSDVETHKTGNSALKDKFYVDFGLISDSSGPQNLSLGVGVHNIRLYHDVSAQSSSSAFSNCYSLGYTYIDIQSTPEPATCLALAVPLLGFVKRKRR